MLPLIATLSPNAAILFLTIGVALVALELNRPGSIVPGAAGLFLTLFATACLIAHHPKPLSALGVVFCAGLLIVQARRDLSWLVPTIATILLIVSIATLLPPIPGPEILGWVAISCGLILGAGTTLLTRIARRARQNKGLD